MVDRAPGVSNDYVRVLGPILGYTAVERAVAESIVGNLPDRVVDVLAPHLTPEFLAMILEAANHQQQHLRSGTCACDSRSRRSLMLGDV